MSLPLQAFLRALAVARFASAYASPPPFVRLAPIIPAPELPLADLLQPRSLTYGFPRTHPCPPSWKSHIPGWRRDFDDPLRLLLVSLPKGYPTLPGAWNVRDIAAQGSIMNKFRPGIRSFFFLLLIFSFFLSLPPLWKGFLWKRECRVCWVWIVVMNIWSVFFLWFGFWIDWADWWFSRWVEKCWWIVVKMFFFFL